MRTFLLFLVAVGFIVGGIYYQNDGQLPFLATSQSATTTAASSTTEKVGIFDRILNLIPGNKKELEMTPEELPDDIDDDSKAETANEAANHSVPAEATQPEIVTNNLSNEEIKAETQDIQNQLNDLAKNLEDFSDNKTDSPYIGLIKLKVGAAKNTDPDQEYLTLSAEKNNATAINITGWRLESEVTPREATIPEGNRSLSSANDRSTGPIMLYPSEVAYVITGDSPLRTSFRENDCSGYLKIEGSFTPSLGNYCPLPSDELLQYGGTNSNNQKCTDFVSKINRCQELTDREISDAEVSGSCEKFIIETLTYKGCAEKHSDEATYFDQGSWRIYLNKNGELWRSTKETVHLLDSAGRLVDTLEY